jgi:hypothetical protein
MVSGPGIVQTRTALRILLFLRLPSFGEYGIHETRVLMSGAGDGTVEHRICQALPVNCAVRSFGI